MKTTVVLNSAVSPRTERHVNDFAISLLDKENIIPFGSVHPDSENAFAELGDLVGLRIAAAAQRNPKLKPRFVAKRVIQLRERLARSGKEGEATL